jgi:hypothetical protein
VSGLKIKAVLLGQALGRLSAKLKFVARTGLRCYRLARTMANVVCFASGLFCLQLPNVPPAVLERVQSLTLDPTETAKNYVTPWLAGIVLSVLLLAGLIVWTVLQNRGRKKAAKDDEHSTVKMVGRDTGVVEPDGISVQFSSSSVEVSSTPVFRAEKQHDHLSALSVANPDAESMKLEFHNLSLRLNK